MKKAILGVCLLVMLLIVQSNIVRARLNALTCQGSLKSGGNVLTTPARDRQRHSRHDESVEAGQINVIGGRSKPFQFEPRDDV